MYVNYVVVHPDQHNCMKLARLSARHSGRLSSSKKHGEDESLIVGDDFNDESEILVGNKRMVQLQRYTQCM